MGNKITFGLEQVHIATITTESPLAYDTPVAIPGAVKFTPTPQGKEESFYADNMLFYTATSNDGYTAELEMSVIPDTVLEDILGWKMDQNGMLVEIADATPKPFALLAQVQGDSKNRRFVHYYCTASRGKKEHNTKGESIKPDTDTITLTITPVVIGSDKVIKGVMELGASNATAFNGFFEAVYMPTYGA
jgi:phi13 family phage major tail protein